MKRCFIFIVGMMTVCAVQGGDAEYPLLPADTSSPRATLNSFVESCNEAYQLMKTEGRNSHDEKVMMRARHIMRRIERCMDVSNVAAFRKDNATKEAAVALKEILDRIDLPKEKVIPDRKAMTSATGELMESWTIPNTEITFDLVKEGPLAGTYQFSSYTVERAGEFLQLVNHLPYKDGATENFATAYLTTPGNAGLARIVGRLPASMRQLKHGQTIWQWVGVGLVLIGSLIVMVLIYQLGRRVSHWGKKTGVLHHILGTIFPVFAVFIPIMARNIITEDLVISGMALYVIRFNLELITLFVMMGVVLGTSRRIGEMIVTAPYFNTHAIDAQLIRIMSRMIGFLISIVLLLEGGQHLGIPLSSLLAGAGVVGMALALSAQDVLKNVFGSIMLILDKPFIVGERIKTKDFDGFVEEVGLRSTKIRLLNGHQASIPNEEMAKTEIENVGRRPFIRRVAEIPLSINIPSAKAQKSVELVQEILKDHEGLNPDFIPRVWLNEFERDHLELKMIYWYHPPDYWQYTAHADQVNRDILDAFEKEGIEMALPAFSTHLDSSSVLPSQ
jgi:MscS family membrane protein